MKFDGQPDATRERIASLILREGPLTAVVLAEKLELSQQGIRRHLVALLDEGLLVEREHKRVSRGRPSREYALSDRGRATFGEAYDQLAIEALSFLERSGGTAAVEAFARARIEVVENRFHEITAEDASIEPAHALVQALNDEGFVASVVESPTGEQVCQHHCPVAHVAQQFPQLCRAETQVFERLVGRHVQRLATIAHGDSLCTTHIPHSSTEETR